VEGLYLYMSLALAPKSVLKLLVWVLILFNIDKGTGGKGSSFRIRGESKWKPAPELVLRLCRFRIFSRFLFKSSVQNRLENRTQNRRKIINSDPPYWPSLNDRSLNPSRRVFLFVPMWTLGEAWTDVNVSWTQSIRLIPVQIASWDFSQRRFGVGEFIRNPFWPLLSLNRRF